MILRVACETLRISGLLPASAAADSVAPASFQLPWRVVLRVEGGFFSRTGIVEVVRIGGKSGK